MTESITDAWFAAGLAAGGWHAIMLWRAAHRLTAWTPVLGMLRLGIVGVLVVAALTNATLVVAAGWMLGLVAAVLWFFARGGSIAASPSRPRDHSG